ncbi:hypothetical protein [Chitinophaga flava]|uniref:Uncharacterized protein n=1 Tax=Chitinophaga flava TaxID=2259036 RepID=A0A365XPN8_9BACT|nr:hypothetical protein [Chitinophaga flava]RBL88110.1 hypothetical protein DF182_31815 [Chitinophaga flava]
MTVHEIIGLMGLKSTVPQIIQLFETCELGKPPKSVNANQGNKSFQDKKNQLSFGFKFDITNERFYPPVSPKQDDYNFECYLTSVVLFSGGSGRKKTADTKADAFWEGFISPKSSYEECLAFFDMKGEEDTIIRKPLNEVAEVVVWFSGDRSRITDMELRIMETREIFSMYNFDTQYTMNKVKQAYSLLVKWLFDNRYLILPEQAYQETLGLDHAALLEFTGKYLKNHIWTTQLVEDPLLVSFLYKIGSNQSITIPGGESVNVYIKHLYIKASGKWDQHQDIYNNSTMAAVDEFESSIHLDEAQSLQFLQTLTSMFELFKQVPKEDFFL